VCIVDVTSHVLLTSTKPWQILTMMTSVGLRVVAPGTRRFKNEDMAMAVPNILRAKQGHTFFAQHKHFDYRVNLKIRSIFTIPTYWLDTWTPGIRQELE
jgi:hypothetical protein